MTRQHATRRQPSTPQHTTARDFIARLVLNVEEEEQGRAVRRVAPRSGGSARASPRSMPRGRPRGPRPRRWLPMTGRYTPNNSSSWPRHPAEGGTRRNRRMGPMTERPSSRSRDAQSETSLRPRRASRTGGAGRSRRTKPGPPSTRADRRAPRPAPTKSGSPRRRGSSPT